MSERFRRIAKPTAMVLAIGFAYLAIHEKTGLALFCPVRVLLGLYCPGCGVSRMFFHIAHLELYEAFSSNCLIFCLLPIAAFELIFHAYRYIRHGDGRFFKAERIGLWVVVALLIVFGFARNIWQIDLLVP